MGLNDEDRKELVKYRLENGYMYINKIRTHTYTGSLSCRWQNNNPLL